MAYRLSVVMIARNAADTLEECLKSVDWADEVILLDSGSTDSTMAIAAAHGAVVHSSPDWQGFGIQRQRAQGYATGDYVLMIDTDERVTPELKLAIQSVLNNPPDETVYVINRRNLFLGRFMRHSGWYPDRVTRLYAREKYQYNGNQVHESLDAPGAPQTRLQGDFIHLTCRDLGAFQAKQLQYATTWAHERHQQGKQTSVISIFTHTIGAFVKTLLLRGGVLDGKQGWILAVVNAQYTFNKYAELWAINHGYTEKQP